MKRFWLLRWRRERLLKKTLTIDSNPIGCLYQYLALTRHLSYSASEYRQRKPYKIYTTCQNGVELEKILVLIDEVLQSELTNIDSLIKNQTLSAVRNLDAWLVDDDRIPYTEVELWSRLSDRTNSIVNTLTELKNTNTGLYQYYSNTKLRSYMIDVCEFLDVMVCLSIGVPQHERRHIRDLISR